MWSFARSGSRESAGHIAGCLLVAIAALATSALPAAAQTLAEHVRDGDTQKPLSEVQVTLLHPDGRALGEPVTTGDDGAFRLPIPGVGEYFIRVERASYTPIVDGIFEFTRADGRMEVDIFLLPRPYELEGIEVRVQREQERRKLRSEGFYDRAAMGFGDFVTPEEIEKRGPVGSVSDLMRRVPGVKIYSSLVLFRYQGATGGLALQHDDGTLEHLGMCEPNVWVDGVLMAKAAAPGDNTLYPDDLAMRLDAFMTPDDIVAIEVYRRPSSTPLQWGGLGTGCGTIVIWTKGGTG